MGNIIVMYRSQFNGNLFGSHEGRHWEYRPEDGIAEIIILYGSVIDSIRFKHANENITDKKYGGEGGRTEKTFKINWPSEYVTRITGNTVVYDGTEAVGNLTFYTNRHNKHEFDGSCKENVKPFECYEKDRAIVGLFGKADNFINSIGAFYKEPPAPIVITKVISPITIDKDIPRDVGPWGGNKGKAWDDGRLQGRIIEIDVHVGNGVIHAIHYRYEGRDNRRSSPEIFSITHGEEGGDYDSSKKHGGESATTIYRIELEKEKYNWQENLVGISGFYGGFDGNCCVENVEYQVVRSISFYTNKGKYGPFGTEFGTFFNSPAYANAKVVGFHGRSGEYLDAIGVHVEYDMHIAADLNSVVCCA